MKTSDYEVLFGERGKSIRAIVRRLVNSRWSTSQSMNEKDDVELILVEYLYNKKEDPDLGNDVYVQKIVCCRLADEFRREFGREGTHRIENSLWLCQLDGVDSENELKVEVADNRVSENEFERRFYSLGRCFQSLDEVERFVIYEMFFTKSKIVDIAEALDVTVKTVYAIKARALKKMRSKYNSID